MHYYFLRMYYLYLFLRILNINLEHFIFVIDILLFANDEMCIFVVK